MSIQNRVGKLERASPIEAESLSLKFITEPSGKLVAAELPELGLSPINRLEGETEAEFRRRAHLELLKSHTERSGPFYELLDTPTLEGCMTAVGALISAYDPNLLNNLKENGNLNA